MEHQPPFDFNADDAELDRYLAGESTAEEWGTIRHSLSAALGGVDVPAEAGSRIWRNLQAGLESSRGAKVGVFSRGSLPRWVGYAAAVLVMAAVSWQVVQLKPEKQNSTAYNTYTTMPGQRARVTLPDNSTIILAPQSRVQYSADFSSSSHRIVRLEGQGLFTVTQAAGAPFVVQTGSLQTKVLGTSFSVRRYATDDFAQVVVAQGRVSVDGAVLGTGDIASVKDNLVMSVTRGNDIADQLGWVEGKLVFAETPLRSVITELQRWYGVNISVTNPELLNSPISVVLETKSAARAIELVAFAAGADFSSKNGRTVFHSRK